MQIAIVDDRAEDREELSACLENYMKKHQLDYTLTEFEDGENFLKAAAQVNFQLVFMDIYMENMDGMGWDAKFKKAIESFNSIAFLFPMPINAFLL